MPRNPSLSFTLSACHTDMKVEVTPEAIKPSLSVLYDGNPRPQFEPKIRAMMENLYDQLPWLINSTIVIDSKNTFPQGAGIASSASAMSAFALCIADIDDQLKSDHNNHDLNWRRKVSEYARLGSGSACRSVFAYASLWGETSGVDQSSDHYAIPWADKIEELYKDYQDTILIVSSNEKSVSSSAGHELMANLPYADMRYAVAKKNIAYIIDILSKKDAHNEFISVCESEALQLHALMMAGENPYLLIEPGTLSIIKQVWKFRKETGLPVCFTLDAGPNIHLLYPKAIKSSVLLWIQSELMQYCHDGQYILDEVGSGPSRLI